MKKLILAFLFIVSISKANNIIVIDSISPKNPCNHQRVKVYCHDSVGTWFGSEQLTLMDGSMTAHTGTHNDLVDSGYVWSFIYFGDPSSTTQIYFNGIGGFNIINVPPYTCTAAIEVYKVPGKKDEYFYYDMGLFQMRINLRTKKKEFLLD